MRTLDTLSQAWTTVEAALPDGWHLTGLSLNWGVEGQELWEAIAEQRDATGTWAWLNEVSATGDHPAQALDRLAQKLLAMRGIRTR